MSFEKDIEEFENTHPCKETIVDGITFSYMLCGNENSDKTLVCLVGGTGLPVIWFNHVKAMEKDYRILTMNYPLQIKDLEELADMIAKLALSESQKPCIHRCFSRRIHSSAYSKKAP